MESCEINEKEKNNVDLNILNPDFYWDIIFQMMISLNFFHQIGYIHLDIKPTNYLVDSKGNLQLTDFSLSIKNSEKDKLINLYEYEGDSKYISPEVFFKEKDKINNKTDIFSLGLSIYEILSEIDLPLNGNEWQKIRKTGIDDKSLKLINKKFGEKDGEKFINLIKIMTNVDSFFRPDIDTILKDEKNFGELNKRYLLMDKSEFKLSYDINKIPGFICPKYDYGTNNINNINLNDLFMKRSDSMKLNNLGEQ
jgi:serine/threonine protein kinase